MVGEGVHPALSRFTSRDAGERVLFVRAPAGTGRWWFASGWTHSDPDAVLRWVSGDSPDGLIDLIRGRLTDDPDVRVAVVVDPDVPASEVVTAFECRMAGPRDLMLTPSEIDGKRFGRSAAEVHRLCGGWLAAMDELAASPGGRSAARSAIFAPLVRWLAARDPAGVMMEAAFLPRFDDDTLAAFAPSLDRLSPTLHDLLSEGLVHIAPDGSTFMPTLIQDTLQDICRDRGPEVTEQAVRAAAEALDAAGDTESAVDTALRQRSWSTLQEILTHRWADLFTSDARKLRNAVRKFPRFILNRVDELNVLLHIIGAAGPDRMLLPLPSLPPDIARDRTAARLRARTEQMYRRPDAAALSYGLLEIGHLRLSGHFVEAAHAAVRIRRALAEAALSRHVPAALGALVEIHAGVSFHLADRLVEAQLAYESGVHRARAHSHAFLEADALSKLSLLLAQRGQDDNALRVAKAMEKPLSRVNWGKSMVGRSGLLTRVWLALNELDLDRAERWLAELPTKPDTDEFWSVHAVLQARLRILRGDGEAAASALEALRSERPYSAAAPMPASLIDEAMQHAALSRGTPPSGIGWQDNPELANAEALGRLLKGANDAALGALTLPERSGPRQEIPAAFMRHVAQQGHAEPCVREISQIWDGGGKPIDLIPLHFLGHTDLLVEGGVITREEARRLERIPVPDGAEHAPPPLTPREQVLLGLLREGHSRREMAELTFRAENTIKSQLRTLYAKLEASSAAEALERARELGL